MHWSVSLSAALAESESDVKLLQSCQSAPTTLVTGTTEPSCTRDAGQQTSEMLLMPPAAVTETVWTLTDPDEATTSTNAEYPTPRGVPADDDAVASAETSPHPTKPATSAAAAAAETQSVYDISTEVRLSHNDTMAATNVDAVEMLLMPPAAVTETLWTLTEPDEATTSADAEYPTPRGVPADDDAVASAETSPHPTKPATSAAAAAAETQSVDDISTEVQLSHTDTMAITNVDAVAADQRNKVTITKDQDKADETLLTTLNRRPTTDIYEDWSTSLAIAGKV